MAKTLKQLEELAGLRSQLKQQAESERLRRAVQARSVREAAQRSSEFSTAMLGVTPLPLSRRRVAAPSPPEPRPRQRELDEQAVMEEAIHDSIDAETLLDTDEALSYRRPGIGADVLRKLRRGDWTLQGQIDLHGHRTEEAHAALTLFLREAGRQGLRCVRVVHGKGLGSKGEPVLKNKVRHWLARREEVLAYCQARGPDGGAGALLVLLRPGG